MELNAKFAREAILNRDGVNHLLVEAIPPLPKHGDRKPVLMIFVIDKSGSMDDIVDSDLQRGRHAKLSERSTKLDYAKNSTIKFLSLLKNDDLFGVVSFDDMAFVEQQLSTTGDNINKIVSNIRNIETGGCTNISDGLQTARRMISEKHLRDYNCKIMLLSDGEANRGVRTEDGLSSIALKCLNDGITISTLGIGIEYKSSVMGAISESGSGLFYHVEDLSKLDDVFREELNLSTIVSAKNVKLLVDIPGLIEIGENMNNYPQTIADDKIEVLLGDIHNTRKILFEIRNNFVDENITFTLMASYDELSGDKGSLTKETTLKVVSSPEELKLAKENMEVIDYVISMVKSRTVVNATKSYEDGDMASVEMNFKESSKYLSNLNACYSLDSSLISEEMSEIENLNSLYSSKKVSKSDAKKMYQDNNRRRKE
jgi:Ca-activated chloride channel homolog